MIQVDTQLMLVGELLKCGMDIGPVKHLPFLEQSGLNIKWDLIIALKRPLMRIQMILKSTIVLLQRELK